jgi:hypothetical protein
MAAPLVAVLLLTVLTSGAAAGEPSEVGRGRQNVFRFSHTDSLGAYELRAASGGGATVGRFAVNLFDAQESNLKPATTER